MAPSPQPIDPNVPSERRPPQADGLARMGLSPDRVGRLPSTMRRRVIAFLLRWEQHAQALACIDVALTVAPRLVSLYDDRAQALIGCGRPDEALRALRARHALRESATSWQLVGRAHLARGDAEAALAVARRLCAQAPDAVSAQAFLAEVYLARGDLAEAQAACSRLARLGADRRRLLLAMMELYRLQGDLVSASAYAARVEQSADGDNPLPAGTLRRLRDYYRTSGETHRALEMARALDDLHASELAALCAAVGGRPGAGPHRAPSGEPPSLDAPSAPPSDAAPATLPAVAVGTDEEQRLRRAAEELFGFPSLRPGQLETMAAVRQGRDVLAVMPTGGGKSLCYQLPSFLDSAGVTLVISPLIALMKDQVESLPPRLRPLATTINSTLDGDSLRQCINQVSAGRYRLVYAAPERLRQPPFLHALRRAGLNRLVIDEAHCISVWGHDFRPDYLFIGRARRDLGQPPLLAMTATAPERVRQDIVRRMRPEEGAGGPGMVVIATEPCRPNLRLEAVPVANNDERLRCLIAICRSITGSGIVYADTRRRCEELAAMLRGQGIDAAHYHAGIEDPAERAAIQEAFMAGEVRVMVATIAFGMGIDKADIRFVLHYRLPSSVEAYYQEAGRAGRDGQPSRCIVLYAPADRATLTRRFRREAISIESLRAAYASVRRQLDGEPLGRVSLDDLARDMRAEPTTVRVALSMLEEAGLLRRHYDMPRMATLRLHGHSGLPPARDAERLADLLAAAHQAHQRSLALDPLALARDCGLDPRDWEQHALRWADAGWLSYRPSGRDPLIEWLPAGREGANITVQAVLDRYVSIQMQRIDEIVAYARTRRCRHDYLSRYLGGRPVANKASCRACDNCAPTPLLRDGALPGEDEQLRIILRCIAGSRWGWGAVTLRRILRAEEDPSAAPRASPQRGALAYRSAQAVDQMIASLLAAELLGARRLSHGGSVLEITAAGRQAIEDPAPLASLAHAAAPPAGDPQAHRALSRSAGDQPLLARLRQWRLDVAREAGIAPYRVIHDRVLRRIAAERPASEEALDAIPGVGPRTLQRYGRAILDLVRGA